MDLECKLIINFMLITSSWKTLAIPRIAVCACPGSTSRRSSPSFSSTLTVQRRPTRHWSCGRSSGRRSASRTSRSSSCRLRTPQSRINYTQQDRIYSRSNNCIASCVGMNTVPQIGSREPGVAICDGNR